MRGALLLAAAAAAITLVMAAPVLESPETRLFGREIVGRHHDAYTMVARFEEPSKQPFSQPVTDRLGSALARLAGGVAAYNILVLISFPLAALFAYLLARHLRLPGWAAAAAALAFAFAPSHLAHGAYHPHVAQIQWIPLYLLALMRCLDRWAPGRAVALLAAGGLLTLSNLYFGLFGALLTPVVLLTYRPLDGREGGRAWRRTAATVTAGALAGGLYLRWTAGSLADLSARFAFPAADLERYGARWFSYLLPPVDHPLAGEWVWGLWLRRGDVDGLVEQQLTLGLAVLALAGAAIVVWRRREAPAAGAVPMLTAVAGVALLGSLAPPAAGPWPVPSLAALLHPLLPMFRAYGRLGIFAGLAVALLAGIGAAALWRGGRRGRAAVVILGLVAAVELAPFPPWRWHHLLPTEGHRWLAGQPGPWRLADCVRRSPAVARSVFRFLPQPAEGISPRLPDCAEPGLPGKLAARGVSHLLLRRGDPEERWLATRGLPQGLVEERQFADSVLLRVSAEPAHVLVDRWRGFSWREYAGGRTFRWLGEEGEWLLDVPGGGAVELALEIELWSLGERRHLDLTLDGARLARLELGAEPAHHTVGPLRLLPGSHRLGWRPQGPAAMPDLLFGNGDRRRLTAAMGDWRWVPADGQPAAGD